MASASLVPPPSVTLSAAALPLSAGAVVVVAGAVVEVGAAVVDVRACETKIVFAMGVAVPIAVALDA